jgi:hypothetical protein
LGYGGTASTAGAGTVALAETPEGQAIIQDSQPLSGEAYGAVQSLAGKAEVLWDETHPLIEGAVDPNRTELHTVVQESYAEVCQASGEFTRVAMNTPISQFTGAPQVPDIQADVMGLRLDGSLHLMEVVSPSQTVNELELKLLDAISKLPPGMSGDGIDVDPTTLF